MLRKGLAYLPPLEPLADDHLHLLSILPQHAQGDYPRTFRAHSENLLTSTRSRLSPC